MLRAQSSRQKTTPEEEAEGVGKSDISIFPLAIPVLSGPGAVATVMVLMTRARGLGQHVVVYAAIAITAGATYAVLLGATLVDKHLTKTSLNVLHRVMGLLLAAIAVQFVVDGAKDVLPELVRAAQ
jgi:multiple antibiotic resistance protein